MTHQAHEADFTGITFYRNNFETVQGQVSMAASDNAKSTNSARVGPIRLYIDEILTVVQHKLC